MKISGTQSTIKELLNLLDPTFILPFACRCAGEHNHMWCEWEDKDHNDFYLPKYYEYDVEYSGEKILKCLPLNSPKNAGSGQNNLKNGCVL